MDTLYGKNVEAIISYFNVSKKCTNGLGLELEHFLVYDDMSPAPYFGKNGVLEVLDELKPHFDNLYYVDGSFLGMYNDDYSISLEPSAQFEISIAPRSTIKDIKKIYDDFLNLVLPVLDKNGLHMETYGYRPVGLVLGLPLIPKRRYEYMDRYFKASGSCGINMMRGTASTQVSIDFEDESDFVRKYRFAYLIMPAIKLITDNTPVFENAKNTVPLKRTYIWRNTDTARCEPPADLFDEGFGFASYANYLMNVPLICMPENGSMTYVGDKTAAELFKDKELSNADIEHIMSMAFPDVRLKRYIEIRGADSMPIDAALGYVALIKALFYSHETIDRYLCKYNIKRSDIIDSEDSLMSYGRNGFIYGVPADDFIQTLFSNAADNLSGDKLTYLNNLKAFYETK